MSSSCNDTEKAATPQGVWRAEEDWSELLTRLPGGWQAQAVLQGAWRRVRKLARVEDLLRVLLVYAACDYSLRQLSIWATLMGLGSVSERGWRKRLERAQSWIAWMVGAVLGTQERPGWLPRTAGRVLLIDASRFKTPAGNGDDVRLHAAYDLEAGRLSQVRVTDQHTAEGLAHFALQPGDVVVTDAGYQLGRSVQQTQAAGAFGVHRVHASQVRLEREDGQRIDLKRLVKHQGYGTVRELAAWVWDPSHQVRQVVRIVISVLPRAQAMQARARKLARLRRKKGTQASLASAWWAGVMVLGTTLPAEQWAASDVVKLYRARWQIELLFKRLKQGLQVHLLPAKLWERAQVYVHLCLLAWWFSEELAQEVIEQLHGLLREPEGGTLWQASTPEPGTGNVLSHGELATCALESLRSVLRGAWSLRRLRDCLPELQRYLLSRHRERRRSQEAEIQQWLRHRLALPQEGLVMA